MTSNMILLILGYLFFVIGILPALFSLMMFMSGATFESLEGLMWTLITIIPLLIGIVLITYCGGWNL